MAHHAGSVNPHRVDISFIAINIALIVLALYIGIIFKSVNGSKSLAISKSIKTSNPPKKSSSPSAGKIGIYSPSGFKYDFKNIPNGPLSPKYWNFEVGNTAASYNNEAQTYTNRSENVRVEGGVLKIEARRENINGREYSSARINTLHKFEFTYGTLEVTMKLPSGGGTWPATWLLPSQNKYDPNKLGISSDDPYKWAVNGEIDFAEAIGGIPNENIPAAHSYNELHRQPTITPAQIDDAYGEYHKYGIIKTPQKLTFTLDGVPYATREKTSDDPLEWPYDQPYYVVLNLAMGGNWAGVGDINLTTNSWVLSVQEIDYHPL